MVHDDGMMSADGVMHGIMHGDCMMHGDDIMRDDCMYIYAINLYHIFLLYFSPFFWFSDIVNFGIFVFFHVCRGIFVFFRF
jgi:hypothetical protein